jgi:hypothetical protein
MKVLANAEAARRAKAASGCAPPSSKQHTQPLDFQECYLSAHYHHSAVRRGKKRAAVALGHTLLVIIYHVIAENKEYEERGGDYLDQVDRQGKEKRLVRQLEKLGFQVSLTPTSPAA